LTYNNDGSGADSDVQAAATPLELFRRGLKEEEKFSRKKLQKVGRNVKIAQDRFQRDYQCEDPLSVLQTHPMYQNFCLEYEKLKQARSLQQEQPGIKVLDLFCGVGTTLLALKKLHIRISDVRTTCACIPMKNLLH